MIYWKPEPIWAGKRVFIVGGGPSLRDFDFDSLRGRRVLAINEAYREVHWADVLFFRDYEWFVRAQPRFPGIIVTTSTKASSYTQVKIVEIGSEGMPRARTSGHNAVALAMLMGARRIVLLGFDWNREGGNYHNRHITRGLLYTDASSSWDIYKGIANQNKVDIINATPYSGIEQFRRMSYEDLRI